MEEEQRITVDEALEAWKERHARARARAEFDVPHMESFQPAPRSQRLAEHVPSAGTSTRAYGLEGLDRWKPSHLTWNVGEASMLTIVPDKQPCGTSMSNEMQSFREKVDEAFGWQGKVLDQRRKDFRAAAQAALLLLGWGRW